MREKRASVVATLTRKEPYLMEMLKRFFSPKKQTFYEGVCAKAKMLLTDGYRFEPVASGVFDVWKSKETAPSYTVFVFHPVAGERRQYRCICKCYCVWGFCKHGIALTELLFLAEPLARCARSAPPLPWQKPKAACIATAPNPSAPSTDEKELWWKGLRFREIGSADFLDHRI